MTEQQYEKALQALGAKNVTTERQKNNGTTAFKLPTGQVVSEHTTGYIRRNMYAEDKPTSIGKCYQLNPTYDIPHKAIGQNGQKYEATVKARMRIWSRKSRLKALFLYTTKKLNYEL